MLVGLCCRAAQNYSGRRSNAALPGISSHAKGNFLDEIFSKAVLQPVQDFLAAITDDFRKPRAAVHVHEQRAFVQVVRLRVRGDVRVEQLVPDFHNFDVGAARIHFQIHQNFGNNFVRAARADGFGRLNWCKVNAAPLREHFLSGGRFSWRRHGKEITTKTPRHQENSEIEILCALASWWLKNFRLDKSIRRARH